MRPKYLKRKGLTLYELVLCFTIISIFVAVMLVFIYQAIINVREVTLQAELKSIRLSLVLYRALNERYPDSLRELIEARIKISEVEDISFREKFLSIAGRDEEGYPVDPFGNRFFYDSRLGSVRSLTKGYEDW